MKRKKKWITWEELLDFLGSGSGPGAFTYFGNVGGLTQGSIPFANAAGYLAQDNDKLFWDAANFRLGLGTLGPATALHIITADTTIMTLDSTSVSFITNAFQRNATVKAAFGLWKTTGGAGEDGVTTFLSDDLYFAAHDGTIWRDVLAISPGAGGAAKAFAWFSPNVNVGFGTATFGAAMVGGVAMINAIAPPAAGVVDCFQMYSADQVGGNACPHFMTENGTVIGLNQSLFTTDSPVFVGLELTGADLLGLNLSSITSQIYFSGGAGEKGIAYKDTGGAARYAMMFPSGLDVVHLLNRAANGTIEIHANTAVAGLGGDVRVVTITDTGMTLISGTEIDEFSIDGTLAGNSDNALPTEKAVKTYVDTQIATVDEFIELTDTPANYTNKGGYGVFVNEAETALEFPAGFFYNTTDDNLVWGVGAGASLAVGGKYHVIIGAGAGAAVTTNDHCVYIGYHAGQLCTGFNNTVIGSEAGDAMLAANSNVLVGKGAGTSITTGSSNMYLGTDAGQTNSLGSNNTAIGISAGLKHTGSYGVYIGTRAGNNCTSGGSVFIGYETGKLVTTGSNNVFIGYQAGVSCGTGAIQNVMIGSIAGYQVEGGRNVAIGYGSHYAGTSANYNTTVGHFAGRYNVTGDYNACFGAYAGHGVAAKSNSKNTFIGNDAGRNIEIGSNNVCVGYQAGLNLTDGAGNVIIGYMAAVGQLTTEDDRLWIANSNTATPLIYGEFPNTLFRLQVTDFEVIGASQLGDGGTTNYANVAADGTITLLGTARVTKLIILSTSYLERGSTAPDAVIDGNFLSWAYDIGDDSVMTSIVPDDWAAGTDIIVTVHWFIDEAYAADKEVKWQCDWAMCPHDETEAIDAPTHSGTLTSSSQNIPAVAKHLTQTTIGTIAAANIAAGDEIGLTLLRIAADNDDPTADPQVVHLELAYTSNKIGT